MNGGLVRLREFKGNLTPSEKKIADYILFNPEQMIKSSIAELSKLCGGSPAAVIRLCKSVGFAGYQELKLAVSGDLQVQDKLGYTEIRPHDLIETIVHTVSNNNIQSIKDTVKIIDMNMIGKAIEALKQGSRLYFYGIGASNLIALDAQYKFLRINRTSFSFTDAHLQLITAATMTENDVAVGISYSGETANVIACLKKAKAAGAATISITKYGSNSLSMVADIPLFISSTENEIRSGATASRITQLNVIDILYLGVASQNYEQSVIYLEKSREVIREV